MSRIFNYPQQSDEWLAVRVGRITGSRLSDLMAPPTKRDSTRKGVSCPAGTEALAKAEYRTELVVERIYGRAANHFITQAMKDGTEREPIARMFYSAITGEDVEQVGFALHPEWDWFGASVDALAGTVGGLELKCPTEAVHDSYAQDVSVLFDEYRWQAYAGLICFPEREWWDLCSFNPYAPDSFKMVTIRLTRKEMADEVEQIQVAALAFNREIEDIIASRGLPPTVFSIPRREVEDAG